MGRFSKALVALSVALGATIARGQEEPEYPDFGEVTKGMETHEGFLRLHRRAKDEALLAAIPAQLVGQPFLVATSVSGGSEFAGWQWEDKLLRFEQRSKQLLLIELNTRQRTAQADDPLAEVVRRTYADRLLAAIDIKTMAPDGSFVIDLGELLGSGYASFFGPYFALDDGVARWTSVKAFPKNAELSVQMPLRGDGTFMTLHYSISELPQEGEYAPRVADDRIGYFLTAIRDYSEGDPEEGRMVRFVNRWKLEKRDEKLRMSPPREPIIFYVEKTVPIAFRRAVQEGIGEWNRAFEAIGIYGAIEVRQQTETQFADLDPEDVRYNFFRWITSETPFAMGPSRVDPRNGRILDADIIFDDSMLRGTLHDYDLLIREAPKGLLTGRMADYLERNPERHPLARFSTEDPAVARARAILRGVAQEAPGGAFEDLAALAQGAPRVARSAADLARLPEVIRRRAAECQVGDGLPHQMALLRLAIGDLAQDGAVAGLDMEGFLHEVVKETVMHEVGHTLGLRHNFKASSFMDLDAMNSPERPTVTSASVMDYHPLNIALNVDRPQGHFTTQSIGPYDMLAIEYGYTFGNDEELKAIPRKMAERNLPYATDEDTRSPDPLITRWDLGADPLKFARYRRALVLKLWETLEKRAVEDNESYSKLRRALDMTIFELGMSSYFVARQVGGMRFARDHKGDPNERAPIAVVDAATQRASLTWVCEHVFATDAFPVPPELQAKLAAGRWSDWSSNDGSATLEYSLLDRLAEVQTWALFFLTRDDVLARLWENEQRVGAGQDALTLPELFDGIEAAIFTELTAPRQDATARDPAITSARQNLQDAYVRRLVEIALGNGISPPVANKLAWSRLKGLEARFQGLLAGKLDPYTRAHLESLESKSNAARTAEFVHIASGGCALVEPARAGGGATLTLLGLGGLALLALRRRARAA